MRNASELRADAWVALVNGLGVADALHYRILVEPGHGDYAAEREALFKDVALDDWVREIRGRASDPRGEQSVEDATR